MTSPDELLGRLRDTGSDAPAARLASLLVGQVLARPLRTLVDPSRAADALRDALSSATASDDAAKRVAAHLERLRVLAGTQRGPIGSHLPGALREGLSELVQLPLVARREVVLRVIDRPALRQVVRAQLVEALADFGRRAASPVADSAIGRGLGGLGKLAGQLARPSPLGAIASAVSGEVERQVEKRAADFADTAVAGVVAGIADQMSDPARAAQQAALRLDLTEGLLAVTGADVAELGRGTVERQVAIVRGALAEWARAPAFAEEVERALRAALAWEGDRPVGELLEDFALRAPVVRHAEALARQELAGLFAGEPFAAWLRAVMA